MLFLDNESLLIKTILTERAEATAQGGGEEQLPSLDQFVADFDGVTYHLTAEEEDKRVVKIGVKIGCWKDLCKYGVKEVLEREYGKWLSVEDSQFDFCLRVNTGNIDEEAIESIAQLKRNALGAPFEKAFALHDKLAETEGESNEIYIVQYREEEAFYINARNDRVTVIFSTVFREETDAVLGEVFLREFVDARKRPALQNAPQVLFSRQPPLELAGQPTFSNTPGVAYITFVLFPRHITPLNRASCISHIQTFRNNLHFHLKNSKAFVHSRMRARVSHFLKVLNRAKLDHSQKERERRTVSGRYMR